MQKALLLIGSHLQLIQNAAAEALLSARSSDPITARSPMYHQLPFTFRFTFLLIAFVV